MTRLLLLLPAALLAAFALAAPARGQPVGSFTGGGSFGSFTFSGPAGNTGVSHYTWRIDDGGPSFTFPDAPGVPGGTGTGPGSSDFGWSLIHSVLQQGGQITPGYFHFNA